MRFFGSVGYCCCFCRNFLTVVTPLAEGKIKINVVLHVSKLFCSPPVLLAPHLDQPFKLHVYASHIGAGVVFLQADKQGIKRPVSFFANYFNTYQLNYSMVNKKDALELILA